MFERIQGHFVDHWVRWLLGGMTAALGWLWKRVQKWSKVNKSLQGGSRALLRDRIIQAYNHYMEKGFCPIYAKENISEMFKEYKNLGGNGVVADLIEKLMDLPTDKKFAQPKNEEEI